eukprot:UN19413
MSYTFSVPNLKILVQIDFKIHLQSRKIVSELPCGAANYIIFYKV